jgi:hypothetical protein
MNEQFLINLGFERKLIDSTDIQTYRLTINNRIIYLVRYYSRLTTISIDGKTVFSEIIRSNWIEEIEPILINEIRSIKLKAILND